MQYTTILALITAIAAPALAAPAGAPAITTWTLRDFTRACNGACTYDYTIITGQDATPCSYTAAGPQASYNNVHCGAFTISSNWSGQFGPGQGFQTLAVVRDGQIVYPGYSDAELVNGQAVVPDKAFQPQAVGQF
ncbi:hypothetical protein CLAFUW4_12883 [Fulvia fulva]|uniref:Small secreted protein n=1 Tax=Passalora fulva TaxID=5499 RepID=A0A9Q8PJK3_PASFU|nr:uncharacterized protein CLAFUR5_12749 [Fulvia fulva]KAK4611837.1 hypothetical protein CLAFUR4_12887 [Fulvia fulva]KAK4612761.1 hypothetical protein CLAFUR0_12893 [Fulvia fulva]UJO23834.1 hypothetical protein CLAFUR5_12749 [Fulvia fulva]WPV21417.1 hypothetical protein CLAFUW4_12883 [Fulvia fulva]WPV36526.1 hypothetical protein CLAFUW7_12890 [Fulvia fulva]